MSIYQALEDLGFKKDSTRRKILQIVLDEKRIKAEQVRLELLERYNKAITLPAVFRHLQTLRKQGFIRQDSWNHPIYEPNQAGIHMLKVAVDTIYKEAKSKPTILDSQFRGSLVDSPTWSGEKKSLADFETDLIESEKETGKSVTSLGRHWWWWKAYESHVNEMMERVTHSFIHQVTGICFEDTPVARDQARRAKGKLGITLEIRSNPFLSNLYIYIFGPIVMYALYPEEVNRQVSKMFRSYTKLDDVPKRDFEQMLEERSAVRYSYVINEEFASSWRHEVERILKQQSIRNPYG